MTIYIGETARRSWAKSLTWRLSGFLILGIVSYAFTHKWTESIGISSVFNLIRFVLYFFHERSWLKISWGKIALKSTNPSLQL
jgi:uncharacterized membrane protein